MAYEDTSVPVSRSQEALRKLIYAHKGTGVMFVSHPPQEGFEAMMEIGGKPYHIRISATCKDCTKDKNGWTRSAGGLVTAKEQEERRVWRVLYYHMKAQFEAADSGVVSLERLIMPYVVMRDGRTLADAIMPRIDELIVTDPTRMLAGEVGDGPT